MPALKYTFTKEQLRLATFYEKSALFLSSLGYGINAYNAMIRAFAREGLKKPRHWIAGVKKGAGYHRDGTHRSHEPSTLAHYIDAREILRTAQREANRPFRNGLAAAEVREG